MEVQSPFSWPGDEIVLDYPNKPILITRILKYRRGRRERESQKDGNVRKTWLDIDDFEDGGRRPLAKEK